ncbi:4-(cytidine 5'-diphospho)-2-C-methyl-D-erythritol kinase [Acetanaerobacterium elongatum]|uniref:4-diphosphocytidyl-2-C-methyl-D-erythritol kinase n=1 Tax=Acetanaerobacterium elongatum TaxID=258515 RepID=A0A1H0DJE5_9FIRM|nr:4-(cytidine 5'-diphospho)-2-C-methyl-D-erythritol kinase [Acetanaerobacterium elongatum]SDN70233.1 4-diphosphocytidyl-2-C-methyl-D-erythritol kinase [Acetanaerobacterium elongatum]
MNECRIEAPAKINLTLDITGVRHDGYHILRTVMQTVTLCDYLLLRKTPSGGIQLKCDHEELCCDETNLACRAASAFFAYTDIPPVGVQIVIEKNIPLEAGLAGGSADAAAVLMGLNVLFDTGLSDRTLCELGLPLGADVPFCIMGGTMQGEGIGEILEPLPSLPKCYFVIAKPESGVNTKEAYALFDRENPIRRPDNDMMVAALAAGSLEHIGNQLCNVLEGVCPLPEVSRIKQTMLECGALGAAMSGSGSAVFGLFENKGDARHCLSILNDHYGAVFLAKPCPHGAAIVE